MLNKKPKKPKLIDVFKAAEAIYGLPMIFRSDTMVEDERIKLTRYWETSKGVGTFWSVVGHEYDEDSHDASKFIFWPVLDLDKI